MGRQFRSETQVDTQAAESRKSRQSVSHTDVLHFFQLRRFFDGVKYRGKYSGNAGQFPIILKALECQGHGHILDVDLGTMYQCMVYNRLIVKAIC